MKSHLAAQVAAVDNAREKVDDQGQINGILASDTITGKMDAGINKIAEKYSGLRRHPERGQERRAQTGRGRYHLRRRRGYDPEADRRRLR